MTKINRNDLCPCGSGKKYKKCCLQRAEASPSPVQEDQTLVPRTMDWLTKHYPKELAEAITEEFFGGVDEDVLSRLQELDPELQMMVNINLGEWSIADAHFWVKKKRLPVRTLLLGPGGPLMSVASKDRLQRMVEHPMSLYEVRRVEPGVGMELVDLLRPDEPVVWVQERKASQSLVQWDTLGSRLMRQEDQWVLSGACYPLPREIANACLEYVKQQLEDIEQGSEEERELTGSIIIDYWLTHLATPQPLPEIVDAASGDTFLFVTDYYRVRDWAALAAALEAQPDVHGDREGGWLRYVVLDDGTYRTRAALSVDGQDSLEVFCRSLNSADESRPWLEGLAGKVVKYRTREIVSPRSSKAMAASASKAPSTDISPEEEAQLQEMLLKHYETWPDIGLPALEGRTPREAVATPEGRQAVVELLKNFEQMEARKARYEGTVRFDFGFLWEDLGLMKERKS